MSIQELRDKSNKLIGKIITRGDGKLEIRDASYAFKGIYDPKTNETRDKDFKFVAKGNMLTSLL